ncbi:glycosyl hydrolases family 31-domain-containing protein [Fennellomyces sp. T-0311]|nr:glycosyl hydrolases family 31-domain-containing protein [Fennellomyces sp. T-0311]
MVPSMSWSAPEYAVQEDLVKRTEFSFEIPLRIQSDYSLYGKPIGDLVVHVDYETKDRLHIKISDKDRAQAIVSDSPLGMPRPESLPVYTHNYEFQYTSKPFGFKVVQRWDDRILFDTEGFPLVFEDQYLELSTHVPENTNIYGFGETNAPFRRHYNRTAIFTTGPPTPLDTNSYGQHPFYIELRDGKAHGAMLLNAHGMDVIYNRGRITWKVIGGILDFYIFVPRDRHPNSVIRSYTDVIGKPAMPALWTLGWHQCRYGFKSITQVEEVIDEYKKHELPLETIWLDIDYMDQWKSFTFDPVNFPEAAVINFTNRLHKNGQRLVTIVEPAFGADLDYASYANGHKLDVFIKNPDGSEYRGLVWPGYTAFLDSWHPNAQKFWNQEIGQWMQRLGPDGIWLDMNEPYSFCLGSCGTGYSGKDGLEIILNSEFESPQMHKERKAALDAITAYSKDSRNLLYPGYKISNYFGDLSEQTVAMTALHHGDIPHYDLHSLYAHAESHLTYQALLNSNPNERPFILTRSSFAGTGKYASHWTGDNHSLWSYLKLSIPTILNFQLFGIPMTGADICGFGYNATEELCTRWHALGAFYPFARNHNSKSSVDQYPYQWESTEVALRKALAIRYALLPYFYTLFEESHDTGLGIWRPLAFEYPNDKVFVNNDAQVLVGSDILISPVLEEGETTVQAQFPPGVWYDWYTLEEYNSGATSTKVTLDAPLTHIPIHVRGGSILPLKTPKLLVRETMATPYTLLIALDDQGSANGVLYIDDGHSLDQPWISYVTFHFENGVLDASGRFSFPDPEPIDTIKLVGKHSTAWTVARYNDLTYQLQGEQGVMVVKELNISLSEEFTVQFTSTYS